MYILFVMEYYYPKGGANDIYSIEYDLDIAIYKLKKILKEDIDEHGCDTLHAHIYDTLTERIVYK